ncbi:thiamine pyrophosphate-dependent enzyme [Vreelandella sp. EE22]
MTLTAAQSLVNQLAALGTDKIFCVPGESYLAALDAMYQHEKIQAIACRHESGAGFMAIADARLTERPGVVFTSRGPGSMNAAISLHAAQQDGVALLMFIGHVTREELGRASFQEVDYRQTFGDIAKEVFEVHQGKRIVDTVVRAWQRAVSGTPGPVVIVLPEDMLQDEVTTPVLTPAATTRPAPSRPDLDAIQARLAKAERPLLLAGGQINTDRARQALVKTAEKWQLPVLGAFKQQEVMANSHSHWVGQIGFTMPAAMAERLKQADLILAVGTRLGDITTQGFSFPSAPLPAQDVIHVYPDADVIGRNITPWLGVAADSERFLEALANAAAPAPPEQRKQWLDELKAEHKTLATYQPKPSQTGVDLGGVVAAVNQHASADTVFCLDSGNFATWVHRYIVLGERQRLLGSASGAMGSGVPYAVAAGLRHPDKTVIAFLGDGGALMTGNELATAVHYGANIKIIIADNAIYGTIRGFQEKLFPGRPVATSLTSPDFAAWAEAFGVKGFTIEHDAQIEHTIQQALTHPGAGVIHVRQSAERLSAFSP